jgi:hypothetical protein
MKGMTGISRSIHSLAITARTGDLQPEKRSGHPVG